MRGPGDGSVLLGRHRVLGQRLRQRRSAGSADRPARLPPLDLRHHRQNGIVEKWKKWNSGKVEGGVEVRRRFLFLWGEQKKKNLFLYDDKLIVRN